MDLTPPEKDGIEPAQPLQKKEKDFIMQPNYSVSLPHYSVGPEAYSLVGDVIRPYGTRVAVVGGETAMTKANPSLLPALEAAGLTATDVHVYGHDSTVANVEAIKARHGVRNADVILAVGGGSVLDGSKLVACALTEGETRDAWDIVLSRRPARCIPYASVMTLPATGSEMNANSVISRLETKEKLAFVAPENPRFSILDPECCRSLGAAQVAASLADITAHVLEQYMTEPGQSRPMDRWAEGLLLTLVDIAPALRTPEPDYDVLADYMLTATLGLNDMICMGVNQDWATHAIGHEITALTGMAHGATLAIVFPALLRVLIDTKEAKLVQMGERVFDVHYGTDRERALETIVRLEAFFASLGLPTRLDEAGVGEDVEREIVRRFEERNWKLGEHKNITPAQIAAILASARPTKA